MKKNNPIKLKAIINEYSEWKIQSDLIACKLACMPALNITNNCIHTIPHIKKIHSMCRLKIVVVNKLVEDGFEKSMMKKQKGKILENSSCTPRL